MIGIGIFTLLTLSRVCHCFTGRPEPRQKITKNVFATSLHMLAVSTARLLQANSLFFLLLFLNTASSFASPTSPREQAEHRDQPSTDSPGLNIKVVTNAWIYVGQTDTGKTRHGQGNCTWKDVGQKYEGGWKDDKRSGQGVHTFSDGSRYEGGWKEDKWSGRGVISLPNGMRCEAEWKENIPLGKIVMNGANGRYEGEIKDGEFKLLGQVVFAGSDGSRFEGEMKDGDVPGTLSGQVVISTPNGARFEGYW